MNKHWVAYVEHTATGEGLTRMLAISSGKSDAKKEFMNNFPEYFWKDIEVKDLGSWIDANEIPFWVVDSIPDPVWELMDAIDGIRYHGQLHYNLA